MTRKPVTTPQCEVYGPSGNLQAVETLLRIFSGPLITEVKAYLAYAPGEKFSLNLDLVSSYTSMV